MSAQPSKRKEMDRALTAFVLPMLRAQGFKGSFPHFRRSREQGIDLITFQFDRQGGGFVVEIARCAAEGYVTDWGEAIAPGKVRAWDIPPRGRRRIQAHPSGGTEGWFRFDHDAPEKVAAQVVARLSLEGVWQSLSVA